MGLADSEVHSMDKVYLCMCGVDSAEFVSTTTRDDTHGALGGFMN